MSNIFFEAFLMLCPLIVSGILHMLVVKKDYLSFLKIPFNEKLFGKNKTYRGLLCMIVFSIFGVYLSKSFFSLFNIDFYGPDLTLLGILLGLFYIIFELPNSFIKRRLGIAPGKQSDRFKLIFTVYDQMDSGIGLGLVYYFYSTKNTMSILMMIFLGTFIHLFFNVLLYFLKIRKEPF